MARGKRKSAAQKVVEANAALAEVIAKLEARIEKLEAKETAEPRKKRTYKKVGVKKGKVGRPRKATEETKTKGKVGRPPKAKKATAAKDEPVVKRRRGRPPKNPVGLPAVSSDAPVKRRRGRPRKVEA